MIAAIRISGRVDVKQDDKETLDRLKLGKKYTCILADEKDKVRIGMIEKAKALVAYGKISDEMIKKLKEARGRQGERFFRLHPPRGGFRKSTKIMTPAGILGKHEDIDKLIERML